MTESELASAIGVSLKTVEDILADKFPEDLVRWKKFSKYFRKEVEFLRTGGSIHPITILNLSRRSPRSAAGRIRKIRLLNWLQLGQMVGNTLPPGVIHAEAMIETTDVSGKRTVAVKVIDDSMEPLFKEGEMIFVNPDSKWKPGDYVIANLPGRHPETILLRQINCIGSQYILHPLNSKYEDLPLTTPENVWGKVVRMRKNL